MGQDQLSVSGIHGQVLGVFGTAKNTGKTTTASLVLEQAAKKGWRTGLLTIGFDGEEKDHLTGLPKPRYQGHQGQVVVLSAQCLKAWTAPYRVLWQFGLLTPLGEIMAVEVMGPGRINIAGVGQGRALRQVLGYLKDLALDLIIVDGALSRLAVMAETDCLVMATGTAKDCNLQRLYESTAAACRVLQWPWCAGQAVAGITAEILEDMPGVTLLGEGGGRVTLGSRSLLIERHVEELLAQMERCPPQAVLIPRTLSQEALALLARDLPRQGYRGSLIWQDPLKLLACGDSTLVLHCLETLSQSGMTLAVASKIPLLAVTVNPVYHQLLGGGIYDFAGEDPVALLAAFAGLTEVLVTDLFFQGPEPLFARLGLIGAS